MDLKILKGAMGTINKFKPIIFFECFNNQYNDAQLLIDSLGYNILHEFRYVNSLNIIAVHAKDN